MTTRNKSDPLPSREQWQSRYGFVLATIGSAVGLGNIWRFSFIAGENGGGAFLAIYLCSVLLVGAPLVIGELALGRAARGDAVSAFAHAAPRSAWIAGGWLGVAAAVLILSYYGVIAGWAMKYLVGAVDGSLWRLAADAHGGFFSDLIDNDWEPVAWQAAMMALTMIVVVCGVQKGIEAVNHWLMPLLGLIVLCLAVYSATFPGAAQGIRFLLAPDWSVFARPEVYVAARGQAFFSLGIGMAVFITYGSYLARQQQIPSAVAAIVAGLAIFQALFAFGLDPAAGPQLAFITLPQIFLAMPLGAMFGQRLLFPADCSRTYINGLTAGGVGRLSCRPSEDGAGGGCRFGCRIHHDFGCPVGSRFWATGSMHDRRQVDPRCRGFCHVPPILAGRGALIALLVGWRWGRANALAESDMGHGPADASGLSQCATSCRQSSCSFSIGHSPMREAEVAALRIQNGYLSWLRLKL